MEINIITCKYGYYLTEVLKYILEKENFKVNISENIQITNNNLHIILFSQKVKTYPKNYIIYQLEQKDISNWIDKKYELSLLFSKKCWDYSKVNINKFHKVIRDKLMYFRLPCIKFDLLNNDINHQIKNFDILFYGTMNNKRLKILNLIKLKLGNKYHIKIVNNIFGKDLFDYIRRCKIVLNISYYENALLECYRINEVQSCEKLVISFYPNKEDIENYNYYKDNVIFVNSIDMMINNIQYYLNNEEEYKKIISNIKFIEDTKFIHKYL